MNKKLFAQLTESLEQMGEISRGERAPSREVVVDAVMVQKIRASTGLSQAKFAKVIKSLSKESSVASDKSAARLSTMRSKPFLSNL